VIKGVCGVKTFESGFDVDGEGLPKGASFSFIIKVERIVVNSLRVLSARSNIYCVSIIVGNWFRSFIGVVGASILLVGCMTLGLVCVAGKAGNWCSGSTLFACLWRIVEES